MVLLRTVLEDEETVSLLRLLSWLRQCGSGWACKALNDTEPTGWQDTERGQTGMATMMKGVKQHVGWESVWMNRTTGDRVRDVREVRWIQKWKFGRTSGEVERQILGRKKNNRLKLVVWMTMFSDKHYTRIRSEERRLKRPCSSALWNLLIENIMKKTLLLIKKCYKGTIYIQHLDRNAVKHVSLLTSQ